MVEAVLVALFLVWLLGLLLLTVCLIPLLLALHLYDDEETR